MARLLGNANLRCYSWFNAGFGNLDSILARFAIVWQNIDSLKVYLTMNDLIRRYQVWDEFGLLRSFYTRLEANKFMLPDMRLVVLPRTKKPTKLEMYKSLLLESGESPF